MVVTVIICKTKCLYSSYKWGICTICLLSIHTGLWEEKCSSFLKHLEINIRNRFVASIEQIKSILVSNSI